MPARTAASRAPIVSSSEGLGIEAVGVEDDDVIQAHPGQALVQAGGEVFREPTACDSPDEGPHGFTDYFCFSLTVATTFGTTDVIVTTTRMRRTVAGHSALTFLFNTIIIALLVTALSR